jgi:hypothetical protein
MMYRAVGVAPRMHASLACLAKNTMQLNGRWPRGKAVSMCLFNTNYRLKQTKLASISAESLQPHRCPRKNCIIIVISGFAKSRAPSGEREKLTMKPMEDECCGNYHCRK